MAGGGQPAIAADRLMAAWDQNCAGGLWHGLPVPGSRAGANLVLLRGRSRTPAGRANSAAGLQAVDLVLEAQMSGANVRYHG